MDISYNMKEKSVLYSEDIRASLFSLKSAIEVTKNKAYQEYYNKFYNNALLDISKMLDNNLIIAASNSSDNKYAFLPNLSGNNVIYQSSLFVV